MAFAGTLATQIKLAPPRDPESKGLVERANGYLETSFLPGRVFVSPADFNTQLDEWLVRANSRTVRAIGGRPVDLFETDYLAMLTLPPVTPPIGLSHRIRLARDYYVRVDTVDYSVDPRAIGRFVDVTVSLTEVVVACSPRMSPTCFRVPWPGFGPRRDGLRNQLNLDQTNPTLKPGGPSIGDSPVVCCEGAVVARHDRCWAKHTTITDPDHVTTAATLRRQYSDRRQPRHAARHHLDFSDDIVAAAMIDRLVHHAEVSDPDRGLLPHPRPPRTARQRPGLDLTNRGCPGQPS